MLLHSTPGEFEGLAGRFVFLRLIFELYDRRDFYSRLTGQSFEVGIVAVISGELVQKPAYSVSEPLHFAVLVERNVEAARAVHLCRAQVGRGYIEWQFAARSERSTWKTSSLRLGELSITYCIGVLETTAPSQ